MWKFLVLAGSSLALGALHALEPGHGKTVVGAYLIGSKGRVSDAILLGLVVTATHSGSVILLGVLSTVAAAMFVPETVQKVLGVVSGLLVLGVGGWMLGVRIGQSRRPSGGQPHRHPHEDGATHGAAHADHPHPHEHHAGDHHQDHAHDHGHSHLPALAGGERPTLGQLVLLGISGGIVPCPAALAVLLAAVSYGQFVRGLSLVLIFSLGMAVVLVAIGIAMVKAAGWAGRVVSESKWTRLVPVVSAAVITLVGLGLTVRALLDLRGA